MTRLRVDTLTLRVKDRVLCRDLDASLDAGQTWAILGANGSGKTTLLHTLAGLRAADGGCVWLNGRRIDEYSHRNRAQRLGIVFQDFEAAFPASVLQTVLGGRHPHLARSWFAVESQEDMQLANEALEAVGMSDFAGRFMTTLSGGERRRVEIATLLAQKPAIRLLDEPTNHLDLHHQTQILELLTRDATKSASDEVLNVLVLHDVNLALRYCSHGILLFDDGSARQGELASILGLKTLENLYHCPLREIRDGDNRLYLPA